MSGRRQQSRKPVAPRPGRAHPSIPARAQVAELFENASDIIIVNDREGWVVAANRAARAFGGYSEVDVMRGVHLRELLPPQELEAALELTRQALDGLPFPEAYERDVTLPDGTHHVLELRSNVLRLGDEPALLQTIGRDVTEKKEAAAFQASLLQVSEALLSAQRLEQLGRVICEAASRVLHVDGAYLWLSRDGELIGCAAAGRAAEEFAGRRYTPKTLSVREIERMPTMLINDFQDSPYADEDPSGVQSLLTVPLRRGGTAVGLLVFTDYTNPRRFTPVLADRATIFGAEIAVAIESVLAREREEEEGRVSAALLRVARAIRESLEEAEVLPQIARSAREVLECDRTAVALWDPSKAVFRITATEGWLPEVAEELRLLELGAGNLRLVDQVLSRETVEVPEPRSRIELFQRWGISSVLAVPMLGASRIVGALVVAFGERRGPFSVRERRIAEGVAAQAAVAVHNARLVEELRRANRLKSEFLSTMSHELRTPLGAMIGYADLMRDGAMGELTKEQADVLDRILMNGRSLQELINMTLDANRLEAGRITLDKSEFELAGLLAELRNEFTVGQLRRNGVVLSWPETVGPVSLHTDRGKLKTVLRNLVENALKFTSHGSVSVRLEANDDRDRVRIAVQDTGRGIPEEALPSVFEMFQQVDGAQPVHQAGVGLGLYLVRRYTELLGGAVTVESTAGEGSTFTVEVPQRLDC